jgi:hypothetical protein
MLAAAADRPATPAVVDQCIDCFLQHTLLVTYNDLRCIQLHQTLEPVVAVDHAPVEIIQVTRGEATTVELHHRAQIGRNHRQHRQNHPFRPIPALTEGLNHPQALGRLLAALTLSRLDFELQFLGKPIEVNMAFDQFTHGTGTHIGPESPGSQVTQRAILRLGEDSACHQTIKLIELLLLAMQQAVQFTLQTLLEFLLFLGGLVLLTFTLGIGQQLGIGHIALAARLERIEILLNQLIERIERPRVDRLAFLHQRMLAEHHIFVRSRAGQLLQTLAQAIRLGTDLIAQPVIVLLDPALRADLRTLHPTQILGQLGTQLDPTLLGLLLNILTPLGIILLEPLTGHLEHIIPHFDDYIRREVEHSFEVTRADIEKQAQTRRRPLHEPDVAHRRGEIDMAMRSRRTLARVTSTPHLSQTTPL